MLIRKAPDLTYADVTPKSVYLDRRKFLEAMGIVGAAAIAGRGLFELAWPSQIRCRCGQIHRTREEPVQHHGKAEFLRRCDPLQQFLRIWHRQK